MFLQWQSIASMEVENEGGNQWTPSTAMGDPEQSFLVGILAYWEALMSFVVDQPLNSVDYLKPFCDQSSLELIPPNPWSGICTPLFVYLAQVGILVRQARLSSKVNSLGWSWRFGDLRKDLLQAASDVERDILNYTVPPVSKLCDTGDPETPLSLLQTLANGYKLASLLELYRSFPDLLAAQTTIGSFYSAIEWTSHVNPDSTQSPGRDWTSGQLRRNLFMDMARTVLRLVKETPSGRGISMVFTLAMVISGSVLCDIPDDTATQTPDRNIVGLLAFLSMRCTDIATWRDFVRIRVRANSKAIALESFERTERLLDETWSRMDIIRNRKGPDRHDPLSVLWVDVMSECRLETIYG